MIYYHLKIDLKINYTRETSDEELYALTEYINGCSEKYYLLVPHLYRGSKAIAVLLKRGFFPNVAKIGMHYFQYSLSNIKGEYYDIYNNHLVSRMCSSTIKFKGKGCDLLIDESDSKAQIAIDCMDQSIVRIGKQCAFSNPFLIATYWLLD